MDNDPRFTVALYTIPEVARHLDLAPSTVRYWVRTKHLIEELPQEGWGQASLPFVSLAQVEFVHKLRRAKLSLRAIEDGVEALRHHLGRGWFQRDRLAHDGRDVLIRLASDDPEWLRARDGQVGIRGVLELGLQSITFDRAGLPERVTLSQYDGADIVMDPRFAFGQPMVESRGVRVSDVAQLFFAGEPVEVVAQEFGVDRNVVEAIVRTYGRPRAA